MRDSEGRITESIDLRDIQYSWKIRLQENTFDVGWASDRACRIFGCGRHVSAATLANNYAPPNLRMALAPNNEESLMEYERYIR